MSTNLPKSGTVVYRNCKRMQNTSPWEAALAEIQLSGVTKRWGSFVGVDKFDLTIPDREFLVLLGPSGCGKTTTMRMIAGLEDPTDGQILIDGKPVNDLEPKDETWKTIPWRTNLIDAQNDAAEQGKPIFIWAMDGNPLGCT